MNKRIKKRLILGVAAASLGVLTLGLCSCRVADPPPCEQHDWHLDFEEGGCYSYGFREYSCWNCGQSKTERSAPTGHTFVDGQCLRCESGLEYVLNDDGTAYMVADFRDTLLWSSDIEDVESELRQYVITKIEIPATYDGLPVTAIKSSAFDNCRGLKEVVFPEGLTSIGDHAFQNCTALEKVQLPEGLTSIDEYAFDNCAALTEIQLPDSITSIGYCAFKSCGLQSFVFPENITVIPNHLLDGCWNLTSLTIPTNVTTIGEGAFEHCTSVTELIYNAAEQVDIFGDAFDNFGSPDELALKVGASVKVLPNLALDFTSVEFAEDSVCTELSRFCFYGREKIKSIILPENLQTIRLKAFEGCTGLTEISIPDSVTSIEDNAFFGCSGLEKITIGKGVTSLGPNSLSGLTALKEMHFNAKNVTDVGKSVMYADPDRVQVSDKYVLYIGEDVEYVPDIFSRRVIKEVRLSSIEPWLKSRFTAVSTPAYGADIYVNDELLESLTIPESITEVQDSTFYYCTSLKEVVIPDHVTRIGYDAFSLCPNLKTLTLGKGLTDVGQTVTDDSAFGYLSGLETLNYNISNEGLRFILRDAGRDSDGVTLNIGADVTCVGYNNFEKNGTFTSANITRLTFAENSSCKKIAKYAFRYCPLRSIENMPAGVTIEESAFEWSALEEFTIPESATIGNNAFAYGTLERIYYTARNCTIATTAFFNAYAEKGCTLYLGASIGDLSAFQGVPTLSLTMDFPTFCASNFGSSLFATANSVILNDVEIGNGKLEIPNGVTAIGKNVFNGASITEVTLPDSVVSIGESAFANCASLTEVTLPSSVTTLGANAFANCTSLTAIKGGENVSECGNNAVNYDLVEERLYNGIYYKFNTISRLASKDIQTIAIRKGTKAIPANFFEGCTSLMHVYVPYGCEIGNRAFINTNLTIRILLEDPNYPGGDWRILLKNDSSTFLIGGTAYVNGVQTVLGAIVDGVSYDADSGFAYRYESDLSGMAIHGYFGTETTLDLPSSLGGKDVVQVGDAAFMTLPIKQVTAPATITEIDEYAFALCDQLTSASIKSVEEVGSYAFYGCKALTEVKMEAAVYIRVAAFYDCTALQTIVLPSTIKYINNYAFYNTGLTSATFADATHTWYLEGSNKITVTTGNTATNAENLSTTYAQFGWIIDTEVSA